MFDLELAVEYAKKQGLKAKMRNSNIAIVDLGCKLVLCFENCADENNTMICFDNSNGGWHSHGDLFLAEDGEIVTSSTDSSMETLLQVMSYFINEVVDRSEKLYIYDDWHEHDGFTTNAKLITFDELASKIKSSESLRASTHGDFDVRTAIYPESYAWLMRWCIDLEDNAYCDFEFCSSEKTAETSLDLIHAINIGQLNREKAKAYFDRNYGG